MSAFDADQLPDGASEGASRSLRGKFLLASASLVEEVTSPDLDVPTTVALTPEGLWAANARFGTDAGPDTEYWLTRLDVPPA